MSEIDKSSETKLTILEHMNELRKRIIIIALANTITSCISYSKIELVMNYIVKLAKDLKLIYVSPPELFLEYVKVSIYIGIILALPITIYQVWRFIKPALKKRERRYVIFSLFMGIIFFISGAAFAYIVVVPMAIKFFMSMSTQYVSPLFSINNYINFVLTLLTCFGIVFEMPLIVLVLTSLGLLKPSFLKKNRKYAILIIFILAAILTPPDVMDQFLMAVPMLLLYEISVIISSIIYRIKKKSNKV